MNGTAVASGFCNFYPFYDDRGTYQSSPGDTKYIGIQSINTQIAVDSVKVYQFLPRYYTDAPHPTTSVGQNINHLSPTTPTPHSFTTDDPNYFYNVYNVHEIQPLLHPRYFKMIMGLKGRPTTEKFLESITQVMRLLSMNHWER